MVSSHRRKRQKLSSSYSVCLGGATDSVSEKESQYIESTQQPRVRVSLESHSFYQADFLQVKKPIVLPIIVNWLAYNIENFETLHCLTRVMKQMWPCSVHLAYREPPSGKRNAGHIFQIGHVHVLFISKMIYYFNLSFNLLCGAMDSAPDFFGFKSHRSRFTFISFFLFRQSQS